MKKWIALLLAAVLILSTAACGNGSAQSVNEDDMIDAVPLQIAADVHENEAAAFNNTYRVTGKIQEIKAEYLVISATFQDHPEYGNNDILVYLPTDILASLEKGSEITFTGQITNISDENTFLDHGSVSWTYIEFEQAELDA